MAYQENFGKRFSFVKQIVVGDGDIDLVAAPGAGKSLVVERLHVVITTANAATCDIEDASGTVEVIKFVASQAVGNYIVDPGPLGLALTANEKLYWNSSAAGISATVSGYGRISEA